MGHFKYCIQDFTIKCRSISPTENFSSLSSHSLKRITSRWCWWSICFVVTYHLVYFSIQKTKILLQTPYLSCLHSSVCAGIPTVASTRQTILKLWHYVDTCWSITDARVMKLYLCAWKCNTQLSILYSSVLLILNNEAIDKWVCWPSTPHV